MCAFPERANNLKKGSLFVFISLWILVPYQSFHGAENESYGFSTQQAQVRGLVLESVSKRALPSTRVELFSTTGDLPISTTVADTEGSYSHFDIPTGDYIIKFRLVGYRGADIRFSISTGDTLINAGTTYLIPPVLIVRKNGPLQWTARPFQEMKQIVVDHFSDLNIDDSLWSETSVPGPLFGQVVDYWSQQPISGAKVCLLDSMGTPCNYLEQELSAVSALEGLFVIMNVPPGQYGIKVEVMGEGIMIPSNVWEIPGGAKIFGEIPFQAHTYGPSEPARVTTPQK